MCCVLRVLSIGVMQLDSNSPKSEDEWRGEVSMAENGVNRTETGAGLLRELARTERHEEKSGSDEEEEEEEDQLNEGVEDQMSNQDSDKEMPRRSPRKEAEADLKSIPRRGTNSFMNSSGRESDRERRERGSSRYSGVIQNPLLNSRQFRWPDYRSQKLIEMTEDGWVTDPAQNSSIGMTVRRFFCGFGKADGVVVGHLPAPLNDGHALWHVVHDDGDSEDISDDDMQICREMFVKNYSQPPQIQPRKLLSDRGEKSDLTYPVYRKSCRVGSDHQAHVLSLTEQRIITPQSLSHITKTGEASSLVLMDEEEEEEMAPVPASEVSLDAALSSAYLEFERRAKEQLLFPGAVTRYLKKPTKTSWNGGSKTPASALIGHLDLVCCVSKLPSSRFVIFDGSSHHCCEISDLAQPFPDLFHCPSLFLEHHQDGELALHSLQNQLQLILSTQYTSSQERALHLFFSSWIKHGGDLQLSYQRSEELRSLLTYREMVSLYYRHLPYLSRNEGMGVSERVKALYSCAFALRGIHTLCCQQTTAGAESEPVPDEGSWGSDEESRDVFFPNKKTKFSPSSYSSSHDQSADPGATSNLQNRKRVEQVDPDTGEVIQSYESGATAGRATGIEARSISKCCHGKSSAAGGFIWRFQDRHPSSSAATANRGGGGTQRLSERSRSDRNSSGGHYPVREVQALDIHSDDVLSTHSSIAAASAATGASSSEVWKCCIGVLAEAGGYRWRFNDQSESSSAAAPSLAPPRVPRPPSTPLSPEEEDLLEESDQSDEEFQVRPSIFERTGPKQVEQLDPDTGEVIAVFPSGVAAGRAVGVGQKSISDACHGRRATAGGYRWRFLQDPPFFPNGTPSCPLPL
jgi:hypothetical protein